MPRPRSRAVTRSQKYGLGGRLPENVELPPTKKRSRKEDLPELAQPDQAARIVIEIDSDTEPESEFEGLDPSKELPLELHGSTVQDPGPDKIEKAAEPETDTKNDSDFEWLVPNKDPPLELHGYTMHNYDYAQYSIHPPLYPPDYPFLHIRLFPRCLLTRAPNGQIKAQVHIDPYEVYPVAGQHLSFTRFQDSEYGLLYKHRDMTNLECMSAQFEWGVWIYCFREWTFERVFVEGGRELILEFV